MKTKTIIITTVQGRPGLSFAPMAQARLAQVRPSAAVLSRPCATAVVLHRQVPVPGQPRKRERLTHLSAEEKLNRRKLKNRIAAQTARDRKKLKMQSLEDVTGDMHTENETLATENEALRLRNTQLEVENARLRAQLEEGSEEDETFGSAAGTGLQSDPSLPPHDALDSIVRQLLADYQPPQPAESAAVGGDASDPLEGTLTLTRPAAAHPPAHPDTLEQGSLEEGSLSYPGPLASLAGPLSPAAVVPSASPGASLSSAPLSPIPFLAQEDLDSLLLSKDSLAPSHGSPIPMDAQDFLVDELPLLSDFLLQPNSHDNWSDTFTHIFQ